VSKPQFQAGDIVELKTGGPAMTVSSVVNGRVFVDWWSTSAAEFKKNDFAPEQLRRRDDLKKD